MFPGQTLVVPCYPKFKNEITEKTTESVEKAEIEIEWDGAEEDDIIEEDFTFKLTNRNEYVYTGIKKEEISSWSDVYDNDALIACFVTPNDPVVKYYNQNLSSNLAILTACETGKPSFQAGEGMISLAHAFNYAGSESILTSLWKIDEQSSADILKYFYDNLSQGLTKDEALRQSKLTYLSNAEGRTLSPQYWAGLVLIGDNTPIDIKTSSHLIFWLLGIVAIIVIGMLVKRKKTT